MDAQSQARQSVSRLDFGSVGSGPQGPDEGVNLKMSIQKTKHKILVVGMKRPQMSKDQLERAMQAKMIPSVANVSNAHPSGLVVGLLLSCGASTEDPLNADYFPSSG